MSIAREYRERLGLSQAKVAKRIGVSRRTVIGWELRPGDILLSSFEAYCRALRLNKGERAALKGYFLDGRA